MLLGKKSKQITNNMNLQEPEGWFTQMFPNTKSGKRVTEESSFRTSEIYSCIAVLADDIAKYPINLFQKSEGQIEKLKEHPAHQVVYQKPNRHMTPFVWKRLMETHLGLWGNGYNVLNFDQNGSVKEIVPLNPAQTTVEYDEIADRVWYYSIVKGRYLKIQPYRILHFKNMSLDGIVGRSPIQVIRENLGTNVSATEYQSSFFANGGLPRGVLKTSELLNSENKEKVREAWKKVNDNEDIAVVDGAMDFQTISIPQKDSQFIETMKYNKLQIAGIYKVPPHKINDLDRATFSNIESQALDYIKNTVQPKVTNYEEEMNAKLLTNDDRQKGMYFKFNLESELRADSKSRAEFYEIMMRVGGIDINTINDLEEREKIDDELGNMRFGNLNLVPLDMMREYQRQKAGVPDSTKGGENE